jgi:hypothetical protein
MSDDSTHSKQWQEFFGARPDRESSEGYRAFKPCGPGAVSTLDLVPSSPLKPGYEISYFQSWTVRYLGSELIAILCPSAGLIVFVEGRNLDDLRDRMRERRIAAIYEYDAVTHGQIDPKAPVVTTLRVEMSNDLDAIHRWQTP